MVKSDERINLVCESADALVQRIHRKHAASSNKTICVTLVSKRRPTFSPNAVFTRLFVTKQYAIGTSILKIVQCVHHRDPSPIGRPKNTRTKARKSVVHMNDIGTKLTNHPPQL